MVFDHAEVKQISRRPAAAGAAWPEPPRYEITNKP